MVTNLLRSSPKWYTFKENKKGSKNRKQSKTWIFAFKKVSAELFSFSNCWNLPLSLWGIPMLLLWYISNINNTTVRWAVSVHAAMCNDNDGRVFHHSHNAKSSECEKTRAASLFQRKLMIYFKLLTQFCLSSNLLIVGRRWEKKRKELRAKGLKPALETFYFNPEPKSGIFNYAPWPSCQFYPSTSEQWTCQSGATCKDKILTMFGIV